MPDENISPALVISLDFELIWGVLHSNSVRQYERNLHGAREAVRRILSTFSQYGIHATWATVGFLFFSAKADLLEAVGSEWISSPRPTIQRLDYVVTTGRGEDDDPLHFASSLVDMIASSPNQEIATHTFSHFLFGIQRRPAELFRQDIEAALAAAKSRNIEISTLVFPQNAYTDQMIDCLKSVGICSYRGIEQFWYYHPFFRKSFLLRGVSRVLRLIDTYVCISGHNTISWPSIQPQRPVNIPASRFTDFYRPYLGILEPLRLSRMKRSMTYAARHRRLYHLWWHPHNFGSCLDKNLASLEKLLSHYKMLEEKHGMRTMNMREVFIQLGGPYASP